MMRQVICIQFFIRFPEIFTDIQDPVEFANRFYHYLHELFPVIHFGVFRIIYNSTAVEFVRNFFYDLEDSEYNGAVRYYIHLAVIIFLSNLPYSNQRTIFCHMSIDHSWYPKWLFIFKAFFD